MSDKYEKDGIFSKIKKWMDENSEKFGFYLVYTNNPNRAGFEHEPWHYTYMPISKKYLNEFLKIDINEIISKIDIEGKDLFTKNFIEEYFNNNILQINPDLK